VDRKRSGKGKIVTYPETVRKGERRTGKLGGTLKEGKKKKRARQEEG